MARRIRRRSVSAEPRAAGKATTAAKRRLTCLAKEIEELFLERAEVDRKLAAARQEAQTLMEKHKIAAHDTKYGRHEFVRARTRASSTVDREKLIEFLKKKYPKTYRGKAIEMATFSVGAVRAEFATKEAERIIQTTEAPAGELRYEFLTVEEAAKAMKAAKPK